VPEVERDSSRDQIRQLALEGSWMRANAPSGASQVAASTAGVSGANRLLGKSAGNTERTLLWGFIAGLAWCPFWFGGSARLGHQQKPCSAVPYSPDSAI
jgi:hypothetical protein